MKKSEKKGIFLDLEEGQKPKPKFLDLDANLMEVREILGETLTSNSRFI